MARAKSNANEAVRTRIREAGLRCTTARVAVLKHLDQSHGPLTHAEVSDALAHLGYDRATIYRNLTELTESGLAARVELGDHVWRFEAKHSGSGHSSEDHAHFLCTTCGEVSCLDDVEVAITPRPESQAAGGTEKAPGKAASKAGTRDPHAARHTIGRVTEVLLKGRCGECQ